MKRYFKLIGTTAIIIVLCLTGLVMSGEAQAQRFVDNGNGTVTDTVTNLMWTRDANPLGQLSWNAAMSACSSFSISGIGGWRLPSKDELVVLYHELKGEHPFTGGQSSFYWSSTSFADDTVGAWFVTMGYDFVRTSYKTTTHHVWPVRAGQ